ncbi:hypothetical protein RHGRI_000893 [Rhododendron griersonianum]|uniref:Uncharacterized protein n=1 Tax=Rhododendron griersonianum TaxID=479676 RepID=A0AAV6LIB0_9ERIC|nr:hypothetical protein RHGRI_000893 [Rhododendron griersonianum]
MRTPPAGFETSNTARICSKVGGKDIRIDPSVIANYLGYQRPAPEKLNYPRGGKIDDGLINNVLYANPKNATIPHFVKGNDYKKMERLDPGPITSTFLKKSKSRSSAPKESSKAFLTTKPAPKEKKVSLLNKLFLQNVAILKCLWKSEEKRKKDKKERRQLAREVGQLKHELHWHTKYIEGENEEEGVTYVAPPQEELVDSSVDEEEEENGTEEDSEEEDEEGDGDDVED